MTEEDIRLKQLELTAAYINIMAAGTVTTGCVGTIVALFLTSETIRASVVALIPI